LNKASTGLIRESWWRRMSPLTAMLARQIGSS
jgi:hypothetical protein